MLLTVGERSRKVAGVARAGMPGEQGSPLGQQGGWAQLLWRLINGLRRRIREEAA